MNRPLLAALLFALASCAHVESAPGDVTYGADAKADYELGQEALKSGRHLDAIKYFEHVRSKYPYSTLAADADLAIGDTDFDREKYLEAIEDYRNFLKLHPNHPKADYAQFRIALSHYKDIPSDFIIFPRSTEKDQAAVRDARTSYEEFLKLYPDSSYAPEAKTQLADVKKRLAEHEFYVADFYFRRHHFQAAISRLNVLLERYPGSPLEGEALLKLGEAYAKLGEKEKAREALQRLIKELPNDSHRSAAERLLKEVS